MALTQFADIDNLLRDLLEKIRENLGDKLKGLYLYGSLVWGDFDFGISDIDLLAITSDDLTQEDYDRLQRMHTAFAESFPDWDNGIEVQYASISGLKSFRSKPSQMAVISPGEPFHVIEAGKDWLTNWYFVQDYGVPLFGPPPNNFIDPISKKDFIQAVHDHVLFWNTHVQQTMHSRPYQSYAVLTLCRSLYTITHKEQVSKRKAADWASTQFPEWADFIRKALYVRSHTSEFGPTDAEKDYPKTEQFVLYVIEKIKQASG